MFSNSIKTFSFNGQIQLLKFSHLQEQMSKRLSIYSSTSAFIDTDDFDLFASCTRVIMVWSCFAIPFKDIVGIDALSQTTFTFSERRLQTADIDSVLNFFYANTLFQYLDLKEGR